MKSNGTRRSFSFFQKTTKTLRNIKFCFFNFRGLVHGSCVCCSRKQRYRIHYCVISNSRREKKDRAGPIRILWKRMSTHRILSTRPHSSFPFDSEFIPFVDHTKILEIPTGAHKPGTRFHHPIERASRLNEAPFSESRYCALPGKLHVHGPWQNVHSFLNKSVSCGMRGWPHRTFRR